MGLPRFFDRVYMAAGRSLSISREDLERILSERTVALHLGPLCRAGSNSLWIAELLANMLSRLYPTLILSGAEQTVAEISAIARSINPAIELRGGECGDVTVGIGLESNVREDLIVPSASGWVAAISLNGAVSPEGPANPYSAAVGAAIAASEVFRRMFAEYLPDTYRRRSNDFSFSLLDHGPSGGADMTLDGHDLGMIVMCGIGAVGNSALWSLARHPGLVGAFELVDPEDVDLGNLERYLLAADHDAKRKIKKVELGRRALDGSGITARVHRETLDKFAAGFGGEFPFPVLLVSPDTIDVRRQAQSLLPKLLVNGGTGEGQAGATWHRFDGSCPCLCCLFYPGDAPKSSTRKVADALGLDHNLVAGLWAANKAIPDAAFVKVSEDLRLTREQARQWRNQPIRSFFTDFVCGAVRMELEAAKKAAVVPLAHQSVLAGALMAAELIKRTSPRLEELSQGASVFQCNDVRAPLGDRWISAGTGMPVRDCICQDPDYRAVHKEKWGSGVDGCRPGAE